LCNGDLFNWFYTILFPIIAYLRAHSIPDVFIDFDIDCLPLMSSPFHDFPCFEWIFSFPLIDLPISEMILNSLFHSVVHSIDCNWSHSTFIATIDWLYRFLDFHSKSSSHIICLFYSGFSEILFPDFRTANFRWQAVTECNRLSSVKREAKRKNGHLPEAAKLISTPGSHSSINAHFVPFCWKQNANILNSSKGTVGIVPFMISG
jgi:hypothetical protein